MTDRTSSENSPKKQEVQRLGRGLSSLLGDPPIQAATAGAAKNADSERNAAENAGRCFLLMIPLRT